MKIFLSYVNKDRTEAELIVNELRKRYNCNVWFDKHNLGPGVEWMPEIKTCIDKADFFLVMVSKNTDAIEESYCYEEIKMAQKRARKLKKKPFIIPIQMEDADLAEFGLKSRHSISLRRGDSESRARAVGLLGLCISPDDEISSKVLELMNQEASSQPLARDLVSQICQRVTAIGDSVEQTAIHNRKSIEKTVDLFAQWMIDKAVVRVVGAGRARLAGAIPANRLAHGGAQVFIQDDMIPMPHTIKQGGVIAVSASGQSKSVLNTLKEIGEKNPSIQIVGIADRDAVDFHNLCDIFIGISRSENPNPLVALADSHEYVCSMLLDAIVVAAGNQLGFDDTTWRLGHENFGATGPYDIGVT